MDKKWYQETWAIVIISIIIPPVGFVLAIINPHYSNKGKMISGGIIGFWFMLMLISSQTSSPSNNPAFDKAVEEGFKGNIKSEPTEEIAGLSEEEAGYIVIVQDYKLKKPVSSPYLPAGTSLKEVFEERDKIPAIEAVGWDASGNIVTYKENVSEFEKIAKWRVEGGRLYAINGTALSYTPELEDKPKVKASASEIEVHDYLEKKFLELEESYEGTDQVPSEAEELKVADQAAKKFNLTRQQVLDIWDKIEKQKYK